MQALRTGTAAMLVIALAAVAAGCGGGGGGGGGEDESRSGGSTNGSEESVEGVGSVSGDEDPEQTDTDSEQQPPTEESGEVIASRTGSVDGEAVLLEVTELRRSGDTTVLSFELSFDDPNATEDEEGPNVSTTFDDGSGDTAPSTASVDGISLIDGQNRQRYLVARDSEGSCVCSDDLGNTYVDPEAPNILSATFGAPPSDVEAVDMVIPSFGTLQDVPLS